MITGAATRILGRFVGLLLLGLLLVGLLLVGRLLALLLYETGLVMQTGTYRTV